MKIANLRFVNYGRIYAFYTALEMKEGCLYEISCDDKTYSTPAIFMGYGDIEPEGISLKTITRAEMVF